MSLAELANLLVESAPNARGALLRANQPFDTADLARSLQEICYEVWTDDPPRVSVIVDVINEVANDSGSDEVRAYADWMAAIKSLVAGELEECIDWIESSESRFNVLGKPHLAANTQTSKLYALALLGRYDEAIECGQRALKTFVAHDDLYSAGKIEHNIGNLYWRRDMYRESKPYLDSAHERFTQIDDQRQLAMVENCQAFVMTLQNQFRDAENVYKSALLRAKSNDLTITEAEIETGLSNLYLFEGRYDLALNFMERSRQKYEQLEMRIQSANCELEIADIYLELNLLPEAASFYEKAGSRFAELGMQAELARCSLNHARTLIRLGNTNAAAIELDRAERFYDNEANLVAAGSVNLVRSQMLFDSGDLASAEIQNEKAIAAFEKGENIRLLLFARWMRAEIWVKLGFIENAVADLKETLETAGGLSTQAEYLCRVSLGKLTGDETHLLEAIEIVENSRGYLSSAELRTSFFEDKVAAYNELIKLKLGEGRFEEAFVWHERSRARTLNDEIGNRKDGPASNENLEAIREELTWYHNRINRNSLANADERKKAQDLRKKAAELEAKYAEMSRRLTAGISTDLSGGARFDLDEFRSLLGDTTYLEFVAIDGRITAFVISTSNFKVFPDYADLADVESEITQFMFQIKTGRFIGKLSEANRETASNRLKRHSQVLFDLLIRPLGGAVDGARLTVSPTGAMNYLPFQALHDGCQYLIERTEISYSPGASVLQSCLERSAPQMQKALLVGVTDVVTPNVAVEIDAIGRNFENSICLVDEEATVENLKRESPGNGIIHLACHGKFRQDNPGFSSLALYHEELTVNNIRELSLENCIIVLSACESGLNKVVGGEELIGLTSAFFAAGAGSLVMSLWRIDDEATLALMKNFYSDLLSGKTLTASLRLAQISWIEQDEHPFFWSPFIISGRW